MGFLILAVIGLVVLAVIGGVIWFWYTVISAQLQAAKAQRELAARIRRGEVRPDDAPPVLPMIDIGD